MPETPKKPRKIEAAFFDVDKAVLNGFRMLGKLGGDWLASESSHRRALGDIMEHGVRGEPDVNVVATRDDKGVVIVSWVWQAGGVASRPRALLQPEDAKGLKVRGGSREMDMVLKAAGSTVLTLPSNEIYAAMQTGALDAAMTQADGAANLSRLGANAIVAVSLALLDAAAAGSGLPRWALLAEGRARYVGDAVAAVVLAIVDGEAPGSSLALDLRGTAFQQRVWRELQRIPRGETITYAELAARIGSPKAVRAVGTACGANPVAMVVPCHRVVRADGSLGGYAWGLERKVSLLRVEQLPTA